LCYDYKKSNTYISRIGGVVNIFIGNMAAKIYPAGRSKKPLPFLFEYLFKLRRLGEVPWGDHPLIQRLEEHIADLRSIRGSPCGASRKRRP
jgi:hypothetical protein